MKKKNNKTEHYTRAHAHRNKNHTYPKEEKTAATVAKKEFFLIKIESIEICLSLSNIEQCYAYIFI